MRLGSSQKFEEMGKDFRRSRFSSSITYLLGLMLIVATISIVWFVFEDKKKKDSIQCDLVDWTTIQKAQLYHRDVNNLRSTPDNRTLIQSDAYIKYLGTRSRPIKEQEDPIYLPLKLQRISMNNESNGEQSLVLYCDCARLIFNLATNSKEFVVGSIDVEILRSNGFEKECHIMTTPIEFDSSNHYSCDKPSQHECAARYWRDKGTFSSEVLGLLVFNMLKIEIDGRAELIANRLFSKNASHCG